VISARSGWPTWTRTASTLQVISHVAPAAQGLGGAEGDGPRPRGQRPAGRAVRAHPDRFAASLPCPPRTRRPAVGELDRAVRDLGLIGALVNSTLGSNGVFPRTTPGSPPLLDQFERLDVPLYLHPARRQTRCARRSNQGLSPAVAGRLATGAWGWHAEAGLHVLRMIATGCSTGIPVLRLIVGHCGEMVPFMLDRIDAMLDPARLGPAAMALKPSEYFLRNIWVTTSGLFSLPPVLCAVQVARGGPGAVQRRLPVRRQRGGPGPARHAPRWPRRTRRRSPEATLNWLLGLKA